ncbi:MAG: transposase [Ktedonobacteraceae bacterium]|nr:transposase [Ktedonobacteraceae bacterium]
MARISGELTTKGYKGSYESVRNLINSLRQGDRHAPLQSGTLMSSRQATWLFLRRPEDLTRDEQQTLAQLRNLNPEVDLAYEMVQQFVHMLRDRTCEFARFMVHAHFVWELKGDKIEEVFSLLSSSS